MAATAAPLGLAGRLRAGETIFDLWTTLPHPAIIQTVARAGFRSITCDFQHGLYTFDGFVNCVAAAAAFDLSVCVRVPLRDHPLASRLLDAGAGAVIMPMVNSAADAKALVEATKFPPLGARSWGPHTAATFAGLERTDYLHRANEFTLALAMIETEEALLHLESILMTPGLDGVFIGPTDLSVAITRGRHLEATHPPVVAAFEKLLVMTLRHNKIAGISAGNADLAKEYAKRGFKFVSLGTDLGFLRRGAENALARAKGEPLPPADKAPY
jgi:4-hydroxy-2-oxoheptanedioate aldolase